MGELIETRMVARMIRRGLLVSPLIVALLWLWGGAEYGLSAAIGIAMTLANLWLAGRIIGAVAERNPQLLLVAAMGAFVLGLAALTVVAVALRSLDSVVFPVTGLVLIGMHLGLVLWEAAGAYETPISRGAPPRTGPVSEGQETS